MDKVAIIILNYKTYEMTLKLVDSLKKICNKDQVGIIVVDNASPNESAIELQQHSEKNNDFILIKSDKNGGYASGNNLGLRYAVKSGFKYSLVINNDIEINSYSTIEKMLDLIRSDNSIGVVSPIIRNVDGTISPPKYPYKPSFWDLTFNIFGFQKQRYKFDEFKNSKVYAPRGSCMLVDNKVIEAAGYLDEATFLYYEEPILAERILANNKFCWHCGEAEVLHNHSVTISSSMKKKQIAETVCKSYQYYLEHYRKMNPFEIRICVLIRKMSVMRG